MSCWEHLFASANVYDRYVGVIRLLTVRKDQHGMKYVNVAFYNTAVIPLFARYIFVSCSHKV